MERALVTPKCCKEIQEWQAVALFIDVYEEGSTADREPEWACRAYNEQEYFQRHNFVRGPPPPTHCPFCGTKLPKPVRVEPAPTVSVIEDGGYYCSTCEERLRVCQCPYPEQAWKVP